MLAGTFFSQQIEEQASTGQVMLSGSSSNMI